MTTRRLLEPLTLRDRTAPNRIWLPPMCMYSVEAGDGVATDWHVLHYGARAAGGFGVVVTEATAVTPEGRLSPYDLGLWDDAQVADFARIVDAIHLGGALAGVQLGHGGRKAGTPPWRPDVTGARTGTIEGWDLVAPSAIAYPDHAVPRELDEAGIDWIVGAFVSAARRAAAAGVDVVQLHGAHGYLVHEFLSPLSNQRTDSYGGSRENRWRFLLRIVDGVREAIGDERWLTVRLSATDWTEGGLTGEETAALAQVLSERGVDVVHVSTGGNVPARVPVGAGYQVPFAAQVREALAGTTTATVGVGLIRDAMQAEQVLVTGQADAVAVGRPALLDPSLPLRWAHELGVSDEETRRPIQYWRGTWR